LLKKKKKNIVPFLAFEKRVVTGFYFSGSGINKLETRYKNLFGDFVLLSMGVWLSNLKSPIQMLVSE
jgi:hypothetical protein